MLGWQKQIARGQNKTTRKDGGGHHHRQGSMDDDGDELKLKRISRFK